jgi:hypothetical protein
VLCPHDEAARRVLLLALLVERLHGCDGGGQCWHLVFDVYEELDALRRFVDCEEVDGLVGHQNAPVPQCTETLVRHRYVDLAVIEALPTFENITVEFSAATLSNGLHALHTCQMATSSSSSFGPGSVNL